MKTDVFNQKLEKIENPEENNVDKMHALIDSWKELGDPRFYPQELYLKEKRIESDIAKLLGKEINLLHIVFYWLWAPHKTQLEKWFETRARKIIESLSNDDFFKEYKRIEEKIKKIKEKHVNIPPFLKEIKEQREELAKNPRPNFNLRVI